MNNETNSSEQDAQDWFEAQMASYEAKRKAKREARNRNSIVPGIDQNEVMTIAAAAMRRMD